MSRKPTPGEMYDFRQWQQRQFAGGILRVFFGTVLFVAAVVFALWFWFVVVNGVVIP